MPEGVLVRDGINGVLAGLTREDADFVYAAIRLVNPGGLGRVDREDIASAPSVTLLEAMRLAAGRDRIAEQYANGFATVLAGADRLSAGLFPERWEEAVIGLHLWLMAEYADTLIGRKCGPEVAAESARLACAVLEAGWPDEEPAARCLPTWTPGCGPMVIVATRARRPTWWPARFSRPSATVASNCLRSRGASCQLANEQYTFGPG